MRQHGIGVGYQYPHDFEDADVEQQYLPDELADRRYYMPTDQGYEATIANRMDARVEKRATGKPKRSTAPKPDVAKGAGGQLMRTREENRKKLAATEKADASSE
jgi:hypothetical protein